MANARSKWLPAATRSPSLSNALPRFLCITPLSAVVRSACSNRVRLSRHVPTCNHETATYDVSSSAAAEANYRLAEIYVSLGKRDRAVSHLLAAVEGSPNGRWGQKSEEYLKLLR